VTFQELKSFMRQIVPGEMLASKPQIIVMRLSTGTFDPLAVFAVGGLCRCINRGPRSSHSVALGGRCEKILIVGTKPMIAPAVFITSR
jgi:hypothetical protein